MAGSAKMAKIRCAFCESTAATIMCCSENVALCDGCDSTIHSANNLACKHERVSLIQQELLRKCDTCQVSTGLFFCIEHRSLLCPFCDVAVHSSSTLASAHRRLLVSGIGFGQLTKSESSSHPQEFPWLDGDIFPFFPPPIFYSIEANYDADQRATDQLWSFQA